MIKSIIDAGPIIALFDKSDKYNKIVIEFLKNFNGRLYSTWPVITEVSHFLKFNINVQIDFLTWIYIKAINVVDIENNDLQRIIELNKKYHEIPMDLADSSLIMISEKLNINNIITLDSDYYIYRIKDKKMLNYLLEINK